MGRRSRSASSVSSVDSVDAARRAKKSKKDKEKRSKKDKHRRDKKDHDKRSKRDSSKKHSKKHRREASTSSSSSGSVSSRSVSPARPSRTDTRSANAPLAARPAHGPAATAASVDQAKIQEAGRSLAAATTAAILNALQNRHKLATAAQREASDVGNQQLAQHAGADSLPEHEQPATTAGSRTSLPTFVAQRAGVGGSSGDQHAPAVVAHDNESRRDDAGLWDAVDPAPPAVAADEGAPVGTAAAPRSADEDLAAVASSFAAPGGDGDTAAGDDTDSDDDAPRGPTINGETLNGTEGSAADDDEDDDDDAGAGGLAALLAYARTAAADQPKPKTAAGDVGGERDLLDDDGSDPNAPKAAATHKAKQKLLKPFDFSTVELPPLKKDFFVPPSDVARLTDEEVKQLHKELDGAKVIGDHCPPPIRTWVGIGLNDGAADALAACGFHAPFAVQSLAIPILMSGRDLLAIAKTGSGKTLAYLLPMLRHVHFQPRARPGDGPAGLVLAPTHELAGQIFTLAKRLGGTLGLRVVPAYGGTSLRECIGGCKSGCDVIVATPGRLYEMLIANRGRVLNLQRCSFVVVDEADRMFDEGFGQHVAAFLGQIRPDRQLAMVSSTMPREVRAMAKQYLAKSFIELAVGGRPCPSSNVQQTVELFAAPDDPEATGGGATNATGSFNGISASDSSSVEPKLLRLLQILGDECGGDTTAEDRLVMVFVASRQLCDSLFVQLSDRGYGSKVGTLYSGMDQIDREYTLKRFECKDLSILIATGVAERGIDIHDLDLVVNYSMPDHYESYVNRIGRTGRAGRKGRAITFVVRGTPDEQMVPDLIRALEDSGNAVPEELKALGAQVKEKQKHGLVKLSSNYRRGFGKAKGYKFNAAEKQKEERDTAKALGLAEFMSDADDDLDYNSDDEAVQKARDPKIHVADDLDDDSAGAAGSTNNSMALAVVPSGGRHGHAGAAMSIADRVAAARKAAEALTLAAEQLANASESTRMYQARFDVNDFGEKVRKRLVSRKFLDEISGETDTIITVKGVFKDRKHSHPGKEPLHLEIRGKEQANITRVFRKFDEAIEDVTSRLARAQGLAHVPAS